MLVSVGSATGGGGHGWDRAVHPGGVGGGRDAAPLAPRSARRPRCLSPRGEGASLFSPHPGHLPRRVGGRAPPQVAPPKTAPPTGCPPSTVPLLAAPGTAPRGGLGGSRLLPWGGGGVGVSEQPLQHPKPCLGCPSISHLPLGVQTHTHTCTQTHMHTHFCALTPSPCSHAGEETEGTAWTYSMGAKHVPPHARSPHPHPQATRRLPCTPP